MAMPATVDMLAALALEGPANVLAEAFERVLDMEEDVTDERLLVVRGGTGGAIRRVFDCVAAVYDHVRRCWDNQSKLLHCINKRRVLGEENGGGCYVYLTCCAKCCVVQIDY